MQVSGKLLQPEVDDLVLRHLGADAELEFFRDVANGRYTVEWGDEADLARAQVLCEHHVDLQLGMVDAVVMAMNALY